MSRICDDEVDTSIPGWGTMNETTSIFHLPVTTYGMLSILQAPVDDNDTITVINRLIAISKHMGQNTPLSQQINHCASGARKFVGQIPNLTISFFLWVAVAYVLIS